MTGFTYSLDKPSLLRAEGEAFSRLQADANPPPLGGGDGPQPNTRESGRTMNCRATVTVTVTVTVDGPRSTVHGGRRDRTGDGCFGKM